MQNSEIVSLLRQEEGVRYKPYIDTLGYPTTGIGFKIGPQGAPLKHYAFTLDDSTIDSWLSRNIAEIQASMMRSHDITRALEHCNSSRKDILLSMAYQMGVLGLAGFPRMLSAIAAENWAEASAQMLSSTWSKQTPARAQRHAAVMASGQWQPIYDFSCVVSASDIKL